MISYSVFMLGNPLDRKAPEKAYAKNQISEIWSMDKFAQHIASHNGVYSRGTVKGVIDDMCACLVEQLLEGKKVHLSGLGSFCLSLNSEGADTIEAFTSKNIKAVNILFTPGPGLENLVDRAEFNLVTSRAVQAASLRAIREGADIVDLAALRKEKPNPDDNPEDPTTPEDPDTPNVGGDTGNSGNTGGDNDFE